MFVAHRGASRHAPENTIPAFELAWQEDTDAIEGDFRLTRDGHIVCIHDPDTRRVSGANLTVHQSTLAQLRRLNVGSHRGRAYGGTVIPTLAEVLSTVPATGKVFIEIKCGPAIVPELIDGICRSGLGLEQVVVISFKKSVIQELKCRARFLKAFWLSNLKTGGSAGTRSAFGPILKTLGEIRADGFSSRADAVTRDLVRCMKDHGYEQHAWTVDDPVTAERLLHWGVRSITTNVPGDMKRQLSARGFFAKKGEKPFPKANDRIPGFSTQRCPLNWRLPYSGFQGRKTGKRR